MLELPKTIFFAFEGRGRLKKLYLKSNISNFLALLGPVCFRQGIPVQIHDPGDFQVFFFWFAGGGFGSANSRFRGFLSHKIPPNVQIPGSGDLWEGDFVGICNQMCH